MRRSHFPGPVNYSRRLACWRNFFTILIAFCIPDTQSFQLIRPLQIPMRRLPFQIRRISQPLFESRAKQRPLVSHVNHQSLLRNPIRSRVRLFSAVSNPKPRASNNLENYVDDKKKTPAHPSQANDDASLEHPNGEGTKPSPIIINKETDGTTNISEQEDLISRPVPNGNWDRENPLDWAKGFGRRSAEYEERLKTLVQLKPGDEGYFEVDPKESIPGVTIVRTKEQARIAVDKLNQADRSLFHACDTEVMDIDLKSVGPVGNGYVSCVSCYSGPDFDYGLGQGPGSVLWIDNLDDAHGVLEEFKQWFEDERHLKVWHNYGFDRHVMWNEGIDVKGFGGDTMHMARLQDTSRTRSGNGNGYGLEALTAELLEDGGQSKKTSMKDIFGVPRKRKDGSDGSLVDIPRVDVMQRDPKHRRKWIEYSCRDAKGTWEIREVLQKKLEKGKWMEGSSGGIQRTLYDYYFLHMRPFGEVLTDMERRGVRVDAKDYLAGVEVQARKDRAYNCEQFRKWAQTQIGADGLALNPASAVQLQTFLFGGNQNQRTGEYTERTRVFKVPREEIPPAALEAYEKRDSQGGKGEYDIIATLR